MNSGEIAILVWLILGGFVWAHNHGKPRKEDTYNFWWYFLSSMLWFVLMWWAGLFH